MCRLISAFIVCMVSHVSIQMTILFRLTATVASCVQGTTATEVTATLLVKRNAITLTELTAFSQDGTVNYTDTSSCTTSTVNGDFMELALTFDTAMLSCGIVQVSHFKGAAS